MTIPGARLPSLGVLYVVLFWGTQLQDAAPLLVLPEDTAGELHELFMNMCAVRQRENLQQAEQQQSRQQQQLYTGPAVSLMSTPTIQRVSHCLYYNGCNHDCVMFG